MKKLLIFVTFVALNAYSVGDLLKKVEKTPDSKIDLLKVKEAKVNKKEIIASLYPSVNLFASAEHFSTPASLKPLPPTESAALLKTNDSIPFSQNILKVGFNVSFPVFIKEIYDNKKRVEILLKATKYQSNINILQRKASLIVLLSKMNYLLSLKDYLLKEYESIKQVYKSTMVGVKVGSIPEFKAIELKSKLNLIKININNINTQIEDVKSQIYKLTKVYLKNPVKFSVANVQTGDIYLLKPLKEKIKASTYEIKAKKDKYIPKLILKANGYRAYAKAYNTKENIANNFASVGLYLTWDFSKKTSSEIQKAKINLVKSNLEFLKTKKDLLAEIEKIKTTLKIIKNSIKITLNNIALKEELLKGAKVAFKLNRMSVRDYVGYEDDLFKERANLANLIATKNSLIANLALIYGKKFEKVFK